MPMVKTEGLDQAREPNCLGMRSVEPPLRLGCSNALGYPARCGRHS
jgi:hypothetical protein